MALPARPLPRMDDDPVWRAVLAAPVGPPETDEEREAYETLLRDVRAGHRGLGRDEVRAIIDQRRAEQGDDEAP